jgi:hypothetical protein
MRVDGAAGRFVMMFFLVGNTIVSGVVMKAYVGVVRSWLILVATAVEWRSLCLVLNVMRSGEVNWTTRTGQDLSTAARNAKKLMIVATPIIFVRRHVTFKIWNLHTVQIRRMLSRTALVERHHYSPYSKNPETTVRHLFLTARRSVRISFNVDISASRLAMRANVGHVSKLPKSPVDADELHPTPCAIKASRNLPLACVYAEQPWTAADTSVESAVVLERGRQANDKPRNANIELWMQQLELTKTLRLNISALRSVAVRWSVEITLVKSCATKVPVQVVWRLYSMRLAALVVELFFNHHSHVELDPLNADTNALAGEHVVILKSSINATKTPSPVPNAHSWLKSRASAVRRPSRTNPAGSPKSAAASPAARNSNAESTPAKSPATDPANAKTRPHLAPNPAAARKQSANTPAPTAATLLTLAKKSSLAKPKH